MQFWKKFKLEIQWIWVQGGHEVVRVRKNCDENCIYEALLIQEWCHIAAERRILPCHPTHTRQDNNAKNNSFKKWKILWRRHLDEMLRLERMAENFSWESTKTSVKGKIKGNWLTFSNLKLRGLFSERRNYSFPETLSTFNPNFNTFLLYSMSPITSTLPNLIFNYSSSQYHLNKLIIITASCWKRFLHLTSEILNFSAFLMTLVLPSLNLFPSVTTIICWVNKSIPGL